MRPLLADILARLDGLTIDPIELRIETHPTTNTHVRIDFATVADITNFAATDNAKVTVRDRRMDGMSHVEHHALYDRPGRRMLLRCLIFPFSPEWEAGA